MAADTSSDSKKGTEPPVDMADDEAIPARFAPEEEKVGVDGKGDDKPHKDGR